MAAADEQHLVIETLILCRDLGNGAWTAQPVAWPALVAYGSEASAVAQLVELLEHALVDSRPAVIARFGLPADTELSRLRTEVRHGPASKRQPHRLKMDFATVTLPQKRDRWLVVPSIDHTFYMSHGDDERFAAEEVSRIANLRAREDDLRRVMPAYEEQLRAVTLRLAMGKGGLSARAKSRHKARVESHRREAAEQLLEEVARPLHRHGVGSAPEQLVGRERQLRQLNASMAGAQRDSVLLIGDRGVGKSALIVHWLRERRRQAGAGAPRVYATSAAQLVAGMSGLGQWQQRVEQVLAAVELLDAILYFDNFAELMGDRPERGGVDIAGMLRPYLVAGRVRVLGELTASALDHAERRHPALFGALHSIRIEPLDRAQTLRAVQQRRRYFEQRYPEGVQVQQEAVEPVIELCERYLPYRAFPGKAMAVLEQLRAQLTSATVAGRVQHVGAAEIYGWFTRESGIPSFLLRDDTALKKADIIAALRGSMVGQAEAVERVAETLCVVKARLQPPGRPLCTFLFVGPTGVGKTQLARSLARYLFRDASRMIRFDMSEYADALSAQRLIAGSEREAGLLTSRLREQPFCVLLFDEIEKAHPTVHDMLLQVLGEARLSDASGRTSFFHNAIIIMTSNLGASHERTPLGMLRREVSIEQRYMDAVMEAFRPEMINRLDRVIAFAPLSQDEVKQVVDIAMEGIAQRRGLPQLGMEIGLSEGAASWLSERGHSAIYGVRALRRAMESLLVAPLAALMARMGTDAKGSFVWVAHLDEGPSPKQPAKQRIVSEQHEGLRFEVYRRPQASGRRALQGVALVAELRRQVDTMMASDEAVHVAEQRELLRAQLATAAKPKRKQRATQAELSQLRRQHHRLDSAYSKVAGLQADVHAAEQLCIGALFEGEEARAWGLEAKSSVEQFLRSFLYLLTAEREDRDSCTLMVHRLDGHEVWRLWLLPLLNACSARGWKLTVHGRGLKRLAHEKWPDERVWSAPRDAEWLRDELNLRPGSTRGYVVQVSGRNAGVLLPLEVGIHRFVQFSKKPEPLHMKIDLLTLHPGPLHERVWRAAPLVEAPPPAPRSGVLVNRQLTKGEEHVLVCGKERQVDVGHAEYFERIEEVLLAHYQHYIASDQIELLYPERLPRPLAQGLVQKDDEGSEQKGLKQP